MQAFIDLLASITESLSVPIQICQERDLPRKNLIVKYTPRPYFEGMESL